MAEERSATWKVVSGLVLLVVFAGLFVIPSAWAVHRGWPLWLAAAIGALAFPLLPIGWHMVSERRAGASDKASTLTRDDRMLLRLAAVAVVVIGPLLLFDRAATFDAVRSDGLWFARWAGSADDGAARPRLASQGPIARDDRLLDHVPADAEVLVWIKSGPALQRALNGKAVESKPDEPEELLFALKPPLQAIVARARAGAADRIKIDDIRASFGEADEDGQQPMRVSRPAPDLVFAISETWSAPGGGAPAALTREIPTRPADAIVVAAAIPSKPYAGVQVETAHGWLALHNGLPRITVIASVPGRADAVRAAVIALLGDAVASQQGDCRAAAQQLAEPVRIETKGDQVVATTDIDVGSVVEFMFCSFAAAE